MAAVLLPPLAPSVAVHAPYSAPSPSTVLAPVRDLPVRRGRWPGMIRSVALRLIYLMFSDNLGWLVGLELRTRSDTTKEIEIWSCVMIVGARLDHLQIILTRLLDEHLAHA
jgi:hypothetical protein